MNAPSPSLWEYLRMRLRISTVGESQRVQQALWLGAQAPLGAGAVLVLIKALAVLIALAVLGFASVPAMRAARELRRDYTEALDRVLPASSTHATLRDLGIRTPEGVRAASRQEHRALVELLFSQQTQPALQKRHDRWQELYGDEDYRGSLKPLAASHAARGYLGALMSGRAVSPVAFVRGLSPEDLERYARDAEGEFLGRRALRGE